jgi:rubrerythrin
VIDQEHAPRELLGIAMVMENDALHFYKELAAQAGNARVRKFCMQLAIEEARHFAVYQEMQQEWAATYRAAPVDEKEFAALLAKGKGMSPAGDAVAARIKALGEHGALIVAIEREKGAVRFYEQLLKIFPQHAEVINQIIREEDSHAEQLEDLAAEVSRVTPE